MVSVSTQRCAGCQIVDVTAQLHHVPGEGYFCAACMLRREREPRLAFYRWLYRTARQLTEWPGEAVELRRGEEIPLKELVAAIR